MDGQPSQPVSIGVMDSGVGGLSVLRELHRLLPQHPTLYYADQGHFPYGPRAPEEIHSFVDAITRFLLDQGAAVIVIACNTASANSLLQMRARYPQVPFIGMEPAVKPAAAASRSRVIGVLSTQVTAAGALYQRVLAQYAGDCRVLTQVAPDLVTIVEHGTQHQPESRAIIRQIVQPLLDAGADQIVLGCTHFPFLTDLLQQIVGADVTLVDPSPAIARQTARVLGYSDAGLAELPLAQSSVEGQSAAHRYFTSGAAEHLRVMLRRLIAVDTPVEVVREVANVLRVSDLSSHPAPES